MKYAIDGNLNVISASSKEARYIPYLYCFWCGGEVILKPRHRAHIAHNPKAIHIPISASFSHKPYQGKMSCPGRQKRYKRVGKKRLEAYINSKCL